MAEQPDGTYHFEIGRPVADRLGHPAEMLDRLPAEAVESFARGGYFFDLADLTEGERVIDLGSGAGMDAFAAAQLVGRSASTSHWSSLPRPAGLPPPRGSTKSSSLKGALRVCPWTTRVSTA